MKIHFKAFLARLPALLAGSLLVVQSAGAKLLIVLNNNDIGTGSLRQAIADAASGDTINFDPSVTGTILLASTLDIANNLTINGLGASILSVSGNNACGVFNITATSFWKSHERRAGSRWKWFLVFIE